MGRYRGAMLAKEMMARAAIEQKNADAITRKGRSARTTRRIAESALEKAEEVDTHVIRDDGIPPRTPTGVVVTPFYHQVDVVWNDPVATDFVKYSVVEATPENENPRTFMGTLHFAVCYDLASKPTQVRVAHVDQWGRRSAFSPAVTVTPEKTAAEYIDLAEAEIAGRLGWDNLDPLSDPDNLGDDVVVGRAIATHDAAMFNLWAANAMIQSAKITDLSVDKLLAGTFTAGAITLAGLGELKAGRTRVSDKGIALPGLREFTGAPDDLDGKISNIDENTDIHFYRETGTSTVSGHRGLVITARGDGQNVRGNLMLETRWGLTSSRASYVGIGSMSDNAGAEVYVGPRLKVEGFLWVERDIENFDGKLMINNYYSDWDANANTLRGRTLIRSSQGRNSNRGILSIMAPNGNQWHLHVSDSGQLLVTDDYP